ncbi:MAG: hypothetical protein IPM45_06225 [Acidimicrobiales bacterium]|nr:hypothetical protein [Acidimicrobiales bacterium]
MSDAPLPPSGPGPDPRTGWLPPAPPPGPAGPPPTTPMPPFTPGSFVKGPPGQPPSTPYVAPPTPPGGKASRTPWFVAIGVVAAAVLVLGAVLVFSGGKKNDAGEDWGASSSTSVQTTSTTRPTTTTSTTTSSTTTTTAPTTTQPRPNTTHGPGATAPPRTTVPPTWTYTPYTYGDDWYLDHLWDHCYSGDWAACDQLYWESPVDSEYETYGSTCGYTLDWMAGGCVSWYSSPPTVWSPYTYGDDAYLDSLWDACSGGDMGACDQLYYDSPSGSEYETYGAMCGLTASGSWMAGGCASGSSGGGGAYTYGDDAYLDGLWDACSGGDMEACDQLYYESPVDSEYETFGATCGYIGDYLAGGCVATYWGY